MKIEDIGEKIDAVFQRLVELERLAQASPATREVPLAEALEEWRNTLEELRVANEELRVQNEELVAGHQALEEERRRYQDLFEFAPDGYVMTDANGVIREANRGFSTLLNVSQQELAGKPLVVYILGEEHSAFRALLSRLQAGIEVKEQEIRLKPREHPPLVVAATVSAVVGPKDKAPALRWLLRDITWRKQAEAERHRLLKDKALLLDSTGKGIWGLDLEGNCTFINKSAVQMLGYGPEEVLGRFMHTMVHHTRANGLPYPAEECPIILACQDGEGYRSADEVVWRRDGTAIPVEYATYPIIEDRVIKGAVVTVTDITDRKRAEAALRESELRFRSVTQSANAAIISADAGGIITSWNRAAQTIFGYEEAEALGKPLKLLMAERYRDAHQEGIERLRSTGESRVIEKTVQLHGLRKDGSEFPLELSLSTWSTDQGTFFGGIIQDITDRKRTEEAIRESEEQVRLLMASVKDYAIFMLDPDGYIMSWNEGAERIKGYQADEIIGQHFSRFYLPDLQRGQPKHALKVAAAEGRFEDEGWRVRKDGTLFWANVIITAIRDGAGTLRGFSKVTRDLTDRKRAEDLLKQTLQEVRLLDHRLEGVREEERTRISREIHDELGVTLTCMKIDLARLSAMTSDSLTAEGLARMKDKIQSLNQQTEGTITQVQRIAMELRPGILDDLGLVAALEWRTQDFHRRTGIACQFRSGQEDIPLDKNRATAIFRICQEALTNVARHARANLVAIQLSESAGRLVLEVRDNGMGIPEEKTLDPHSLGLLGMRERVRPFGGELLIQGIPGEGTTIRVVMPLVAEQPGEKPQ